MGQARLALPDWGIGGGRSEGGGERVAIHYTSSLWLYKLVYKPPPLFCERSQQSLPQFVFSVRTLGTVARRRSRWSARGAAFEFNPQAPPRPRPFGPLLEIFFPFVLSAFGRKRRCRLDRKWGLGREVATLIGTPVD